MRVVAVAVEAVLDLLAVVEGLLHALDIHPGAVPFGLIEKFGMNAHFGKNVLHIHFVVPRVAFIAAEGVGNEGDGITQVFLQFVLFRHVGRNLAEDVVIVPGINEANFFSAFLEGPHNEIDGNDLAEIADMDRARRGNTGGASVDVQVAALTDDFLGGLVRPVK